MDMMPVITPVIIIVGADKGGVGKTTIARTLLDYYNSKNISCQGVDTEHPQGILKRFYSERDDVNVVDLTKSNGQMKVFDGIRNHSVTLIDIRAGLLSKTLEMLNVTGFFESAKSGKHRIVVMHILGDTEASMDEVAAVAKIIPDARRILVKNHVNEGAFEGTPIALGPTDEVMDIPKLDELAAKNVDRAGVSFTGFIANTGNSEVLRGYTRHWLRAVHDAYSRAGLDAITT